MPLNMEMPYTELQAKVYKLQIEVERLTKLLAEADDLIARYRSYAAKINAIVESTESTEKATLKTT
jgi:hypothetical protein